MVSLDLTAKLGDAELAELLELRDGVGEVWIGVGVGVGVGVGEAAAKVAETEAAVVVVVASVHQPSRRVLVLVDRLLILSCDRAAYCGDPRCLANFLAPFGCPVPAGESPAEFALDVVRSSSPARRRRSSSSTPPPLRDAIAASISQGKLVSSWGC
uniref:Uncharacterized protein n=1 Tax=Ananas comosus var. bracteatus TaxID=296719 RepID=A0A6V7NYX7_ANACO|nr:unnamed protein product [Ananas comosus var. bracteatus]